MYVHVCLQYMHFTNVCVCNADWNRYVVSVCLGSNHAGDAEQIPARPLRLPHDCTSRFTICVLDVSACACLVVFSIPLLFCFCFFIWPFAACPYGSVCCSVCLLVFLLHLICASKKRLKGVWICACAPYCPICLEIICFIMEVTCVQVFVGHDWKHRLVLFCLFLVLVKELN